MDPSSPAGVPPPADAPPPDAPPLDGTPQAATPSASAATEEDTVILDEPVAATGDASLNPPPTSGDLLNDRYRLLELIGAGGTSRVYKAADTAQGGNFIAVKVLIRPWVPSDASFRTLELEVAEQAALEHPAIVPVTGCGRAGEFVFLTMAYVAGRSLQVQLATDAAAGVTLGAAEAVRIITTVAGALEHAHRHGMIHGDVKPGNVLIDEQGAVKLIDVGLSRWTARAARGTAAVTPRYASPQLMARQEPGVTDDVYSLACLAYELLAGKHPFGGRGADTGPFPPPLRPGLTTLEYAAIVGGLQPEQSDRTPTVSDFMLDFAPRVSLKRPASPPPEQLRKDPSGARSGMGWGAWVAGWLALAVALGWIYINAKVSPPPAPPPATATRVTPETAPPPAGGSGAATTTTPPTAVTPPAPGTAIRDCPKCPLLTVVPAGRFVQGAARTSAHAPSYEQPPHVVLFRHPLALSVDDVTVSEFAAFIDATHRDMQGCDVYDGHWHHLDSADWQHPGFEQGDSHPVTCTSWQDATDYARWLSDQTGQHYRLPSASEWEYAARAAGNVDEPWEAPAEACTDANVADQAAARQYPGWTVFPCNDGYVHTAPVGSFKANALGLHDMMGNVFQWTADCWYPNYDKAPIDGSPRRDGDCSEHELRGGSWFTSPAYVHPSYRNHFAAAYRSASVGFRVARELPP